MDAFIWPSDEMTACWMACPNVTEEENCKLQSGCSESHAHQILRPKRDLRSTILCQLAPSSGADITAHRCRSGQLFAANNWNCWRMVSFRSRTMQHLITIVMCKIWCNVMAGRCWHILSTLQILPHVIIGYLHVWQNFCRGGGDLNRKTKSTLLSLTLYTVQTRMFIELQMTVHHVVGKVCG